VQISLVSLNCQQVVGSLLDDGSSDIFLTAHSICGNQTSFQIKQSKELWDCCDFIRFLVSPDLPDGYPIGCGEGTHQMQGTLRAAQRRSLERMTVGFPVDGHNPTFS
jgi:hypothetical protein